MKKIVMILAMAATVSFGYAQDDNKSAGFERRQPNPEQMTKMMAERLGLNEQQTKDFEALNKEYADVLGGPGFGRRGFGGPGRPGGPGFGGPGRPGGQHPQQFGQQKEGEQAAPQRPQLTEEQREQMKARMKEMQAKRAEYDKKVQEILTKEQYEKLQEMRPQPGMRPGPGMQRAPRGNMENLAPKKD